MLEEGHAERVLLGLRKPRICFFLDGREEIGEGREGELRLSLCRTTGDGTKSSFLAEAERLPPESRLPDPSVAFEDEGDIPVTRIGEESSDPRQLGLASDHRSHARSLRPETCDFQTARMSQQP
jgi:hypothetical protein